MNQPTRSLVEAATLAQGDLISSGNVSYRVIEVTNDWIESRIRVRSTQVGISPQHVTVFYFNPAERVAKVGR